MTDRHAAWDAVPSGLLTLDGDGLILDANRTFLDWVGRSSQEVVGRLRLNLLLSVGGRIYWETHLSPLLHAEGRVDEVALELRGPDGRVPVLLSAVATATSGGRTEVHVALSGASDRSRYERELLHARREAERAASRTRVLQEVTAALSGAAGADAVAEALLAAARSFGAAAGTCWLRDQSGTFQPRAASGEPLESAGPAPAGFGRGAEARDGRVLVPLRGRTDVHGVLSLLPFDGAGADPVDLPVLTAVGLQAGVALDRVVLYERSAAVAHQLQQSLLSAAAPTDDRFEVTTAYSPGVESLEVGGDWYDAFLVTRAVLAVVVGDVVGRGLRAAAAMGQLRSAVRALAASGDEPAEVLLGLDRFVQHVPEASFSTLAYGELDLTTGRLRYASAGHLPPLLSPADGAARLVWEGRSAPLGVALPGGRAEAVLELAPGDRLLLYTDGLVERRDRPLSAGLAELAAVAADEGGRPANEVPGMLMERLVPPGERHDDVCLLLLTWRGPAPLL